MLFTNPALVNITDEISIEYLSDEYSKQLFSSNIALRQNADIRYQFNSNIPVFIS
jgi:hypothetical protein